MAPNPIFPPFYRGNRRHPLYNNQYERKILFLRSGVPPDVFLQNLRGCKIKELKYLRGLNAFVGLFPRNPYTDNFLRHPDIFQIDEDLEVKILIPFKGTIVNRSQVIPWGIERIGAEKAWPVTQGQGVRVAVIDTGIAFDHSDLNRNVKGGTNILNSFLPPYDHNGHGTHVAGTIGALNNQLGVVGVAPKVDLFAVKAFKKDGTAKLSDIINAIDWSIENKMDIINMSFGFNEPSPTFREAVIRANQAGILMIAASGNKGTRGMLEYPAQFNETVAVSSINENNEISKFSTIGPGIDLTAPGEKIMSTWLNNSFRELSGTSMSVAHVTGVAALLMSRYPKLPASEINYILKGYARKLQNSSYIAQGAGLVNAAVFQEAAEY